MGCKSSRGKVIYWDANTGMHNKHNHQHTAKQPNRDKLFRVHLESIS